MDATKLPTSTQMRYFDWKGDPHFTRNPAIDGSGTYTLYWSAQPLDKDDALITGAFLVSATAKDGENYTFWVPASAVAADGLSATGCVGGIRPNGLDYTTKDTTFAPTSTAILSGMQITCGLPAVLGELLRAAVQGVIQTGSVSINLGTGASEDAYIYHNGNPWLKQTSAGVAQYWNGSSYVAFNDSIASSLVKVSVTDTTPDYLYNKVGSSDGSIVFDVTGDGADETLDLVTALPARISSHVIYTPAYMTGGTSAEQTIALWDSVSDGSFRLTLDGSTYNITGINFTSPIVTTMAEVATRIQDKLQTVTGTTATVAWSTNKFIITSTNTTSASAVSVLTTATASVGTDISGAGAGTWMDSETGRGTATAAVLDPTQDSGKIGLLNARGSFPADLARDFVASTGYTAKGGMMVATAANAVSEQAAGANDFGLRYDSSQSTGVKAVPVSRPLGFMASAVTVANTTTETDVLSVSVPANTLGTANGVRIFLWFSDIDGGNGANGHLLFRLKLGSTTLVTHTWNDSGAAYSNRQVFMEGIINSAGTTSSQRGCLLSNISTNALGTTYDPTSGPTSNYWQLAGVGTASENSTGALTFKVTVQWSEANASNSCVATYGYAEILA